VRLSPKSIFFGIVALGLPFTVTVGWTLGTPAAVPAAVSAPGGSGTIGAAPQRGVTSPVTAADYAAEPPRDTASTAASTAPVAVPSSTAAPADTVTVTLSPLPTLTDPPVPTPTLVTSAPPIPSATPSTSTSAEPGGIDPARLVHRP
jgi:hypothetical protein